MSRSIMNLIARIEDSTSADVSLKDVRVLAKSRDPEVISALAGLLDDDGRVGREAVRALRGVGREAVEALRRCHASHDETMRAHAEELLAALGEGTAEELGVLPVPERGNDNDVEVADLTLLADPEVVRSIGNVLVAHGVPWQDFGDGTAEVQTRVLEALRIAPAPANLAEWRAMANKVAEEYAIDLLRKRDARGKQDDGPCEDPDSFFCREIRDYDPIDANRLFQIFKEMAQGGELSPLAADIAEARMAGLTETAIAEEFGLTRIVVLKRRGVTRARFSAKLLSMGMAELIPRAAERTKRGKVVEEENVDDVRLGD